MPNRAASSQGGDAKASFVNSNVSIGAIRAAFSSKPVFHLQAAGLPAKCQCLSQIKSGHICDAVRRGLAAKNTPCPLNSTR